MKSLMQYIQGSRKGKEAHRLEKEAMKDPFLSDALDGFQAVKGNHVESIEEMRRRISHRTRSHRDSITKWSIAASLLICLGFGSYFWLDRQLGMPAQSPLAVVMEEQAAPLQQAPLAGIAADSMQEQESASGAGETKAKVSEGTPQSPAPVVAETSVAQVAVYSAPCEDVAVADIVAEEEAPVAAKALTRSMPRHIPQPVIGEEAYREYQLALRSFNQQLMLLGELLGLGDKLSSYTARHTWATMAYYCEVHPGVISEAMGHSSITVTETYLKPFKNKKIDEANVAVISSLKKVYSVGKLLN